MWIILKSKKNKIKILLSEIRKSYGKDINFFIPKIKINKIKNFKKFAKEKNLLGDYILCYHPSFEDKKLLNSLKYTRGLSYLLEEFVYSQDNILNFIKRCKKYEDANGFIKQNFFEINSKSDEFTFLSGPFTNFIFSIINEQKSKFDISLGNFKTSVSKEKYLFRSV